MFPTKEFPPMNNFKYVWRKQAIKPKWCFQQGDALQWKGSRMFEDSYRTSEHNCDLPIKLYHECYSDNFLSFTFSAQWATSRIISSSLYALTLICSYSACPVKTFTKHLMLASSPSYALLSGNSHRASGHKCNLPIRLDYERCRDNFVSFKLSADHWATSQIWSSIFFPPTQFAL